MKQSSRWHVAFYPSMVEFFNSEEGQREYEEWLKEQEALQALPVAA